MDECLLLHRERAPEDRQGLALNCEGAELDAHRSPLQLDEARQQVEPPHGRYELRPRQVIEQARQLTRERIPASNRARRVDLEQPARKRVETA